MKAKSRKLKTEEGCGRPICSCHGALEDELGKLANFKALNQQVLQVPSAHTCEFGEEELINPPHTARSLDEHLSFFIPEF